MKKSAMLMLCLVLVFALAACAGTDTTPQGSVSDTVTVTDMKGEVAIPANPQRIVDVAGLTEELLILDMKVIASANTSMFDGVSVPKHLTTLFAERGIEVVGNYSGSSSTGDLNLEKIAELKPDLIIMNIRHEKVYEQLAAIAPTVMIDDDISYVNWRGRFKQLGQWFDKEAAVEKWLADYDAKAAELAARIRDMIGDETFAVLEANSVHFGSYYIYRSGGPGELVYDELKLTPSAGVPENVWGEVVDSQTQKSPLWPLFGQNGSLGAGRHTPPPSRRAAVWLSARHGAFPDVARMGGNVPAVLICGCQAASELRIFRRSLSSPGKTLFYIAFTKIFLFFYEAAQYDC